MTTDGSRVAYSPQEVGDLVKLPYSTVLTLIKRGELKAVRAGKRWRVSAREIDRWLADGAAA